MCGTVGPEHRGTPAPPTAPAARLSPALEDTTTGSTTEVYFLSILEAGSLRPRGGQEGFLLRPWLEGGRPPSVSSRGLASVCSWVPISP